MAKRKDKDDQANENLNDGNSGEDNFGLPEVEYKPLEKQEEQNVEESTYKSEETVRESYSYTPTEEPKSNAPVIIAVIIGLVLIVAGYLIWEYVYKPQKAEKAKKELADQKARDKAAKEKADREAAERAAEEQRRKDAEAAAALAAKPAIGTIETLSSRSGRYYVVVASAVDGDLIMDYAKKLSAKGTSTRIIPPFGKWKFYRLTVGDYDSYATAQTNADSAKPEFGAGAWVIKY
ncbi:MAG: SPOR domain-containing protein [Cyclobacteriaceae bacterium]|nr:SPOR domain-containing protein [Cyclobacteriaceae bacterium]